jgi:phytoene dehydrogenase-like protein
MSQSIPDPVIVIGAGVSGLVTARELHRLGHPVSVLEAADAIGGKLATRRTDAGYLLDRGFQIVLGAYPALKRHIDLDALGARAFERGAAIATAGTIEILADPFSHPAAAWRDLQTGLFSPGDKLRLARLAIETARHGWQSAAQAANEMDTDLGIRAYLHQQGFSDAFIERFARPFWGGITLDQDLGVSAGILRFTLKMFLQGRGVLPEGGIAAIPAALAAGLPDGTVETGVAVTGLVIDNGVVTGVETATGRRSASAVVVATDTNAAHALTGLDVIPTATVGCTTVYVATSDDPGIGRYLVLNAEGGFINHVAPVSAVQPSYAPEGRHLLALVSIEQASWDLDDAAILTRAQESLAGLLPHVRAEPVGIERVPHALFRQTRGFTACSRMRSLACPGSCWREILRSMPA